MPLKIPADAKVITDQRLTIIRACATLQDRLCKGDGGLIDQVKESMDRKGAVYAESEFVIAELRNGEGRATIDTAAAFVRCKEKKIKLEDFLACCTVRKSDLKKLLAENEIDEISTITPVRPALITEFRQAIDAVMDPELLYKAIGRGIGGHLKALSTARA